MVSPVKLWRNQKQVKKLLGKEGSVVSYTVVRVPPAGHESEAPYPVVLVKINNETHIGQLVDYEDVNVRIGLKVKTVLRRTREPDSEGVIPYGIKFKPI